ncbi:hypothetical protein BJ165DRAFT_1410421 [Panaeolus papilionaceus]|nr:hypothetical protein BJ165DRAFT_1410421 [Panaeolus papilionaceus]
MAGAEAGEVRLTDMGDMTENAPDTITSLETKVEATLGLLEFAPNEDVKKEWGKNYKSLMEDLKKLGSLSGGKQRLQQWPSVAIIDVLKVARRDPNYKLPKDFDLKTFIQERRRKGSRPPGVPEVARSSGEKQAEEPKKKMEGKPGSAKKKEDPKKRDERVRERAKVNEAGLNARLHEVEKRMRLESEYDTGEGTGRESLELRGKRKRRGSESPHKDDKPDNKPTEKPDRALKKKQRTDDEQDESESKGKLVTYTSKQQRGKGGKREEEVEEAESGTGSDKESRSEEDSDGDDANEEEAQEEEQEDMMEVEDGVTKKKKNSKKGKEKATDKMEVDESDERIPTTPTVPVDAHIPSAPRSTKNGAAWTQKATSDRIFATLYTNKPPCDWCAEKKDTCYKQYFPVNAKKIADQGGKALGRACYYCAGSHQKCSLNADVSKAGSAGEGPSRISAPPPEGSKTTKPAKTPPVPPSNLARTIRPAPGNVPLDDFNKTKEQLDQALNVIQDLLTRVELLEGKLASGESASHGPSAQVADEEGGRSFRASTRSARAARAAEEDSALRDTVELLRQTSDANIQAIAESYEGVRISIADLRKHVERVNRQTQQLYNSHRAHLAFPGFTAMPPERYARPEFRGVPIPLILHMTSGAKVDITTDIPQIALAEHIVTTSGGNGFAVSKPWDPAHLFMPCNPKEWVQAPIVTFMQRPPSGQQIMTPPNMHQAMSGPSSASGLFDPPNTIPTPTTIGAPAMPMPQGDTVMMPPPAFAPSISRPPPAHPTTVSTKVVPATSIRGQMAAPAEVVSQAEDSTPAGEDDAGEEEVPTKKSKKKPGRHAAKKKTGN